MELVGRLRLSLHRRAAGHLEGADHLHASVGGFRFASRLARKNGPCSGYGAVVLTVPPAVLATQAIDLDHPQAARSQEA
jgi:hypothetical protein